MNLLTTLELARQLKTTTRTIRRLRMAGKLPQPFRWGHRTIRWDLDEVMKHAESTKTEG